MLDGIHKIHLIGIGGSGMRAIANILIQKGYDVSGSDVADSAVIESSEIWALQFILAIIKIM